MNAESRFVFIEVELVMDKDKRIIKNKSKMMTMQKIILVVFIFISDGKKNYLSIKN
jgi:hypothetical protein